MDWSPLTHLFGSKPRVRAMEALLDLSPHEFTLVDFADQAGNDKNIARQVPALEAEGLLVRASTGPVPTFRVKTTDPWFRTLDLVSFILDDISPGDDGHEFDSRISSYWDAVRAARTSTTTASSARSTSATSQSKSDTLELTC